MSSSSRVATSRTIVSAIARCLAVGLIDFRNSSNSSEVHLADFEKIAPVDGHQPTGPLEAGPAAFGAVVFDHHLLQVLVHAGVRRALLAILAIVMLQLIDDAGELDLLAGVLLPMLGARRQRALRTAPPWCRRAGRPRASRPDP